MVQGRERRQRALIYALPIVALLLVGAIALSTTPVAADSGGLASVSSTSDTGSFTDRSCPKLDQGRRERIDETTEYPRSAVVYLQDERTSEAAGSGFLVAPNVVVTAAHVLGVTDPEALVVAPGADGNQRPYGEVEVVDWWKAPGFDGVGDRRDDMAVLKLAEPVGYETGWFDVGTYTPARFDGLTVTGYPKDRPHGTMWEHTGPAERTNSDPPAYAGPIETCYGNSGSPFWVYNDGVPKAFATLSGPHDEDTESIGTGFTSTRVAVINDFAPADNPEFTIDKLRIDNLDREEPAGVAAGNEIRVLAEVRNVGDRGMRTSVVHFDGGLGCAARDPYEGQPKYVEPGDSVAVHWNCVVPKSASPGETFVQEVSIQGDDSMKQHPLEVLEPATYDVSVAAAPPVVETGDPVAVDVTATNGGGVADDQSVSLSIGGQHVTEQEVRTMPGSGTTVTLQGDAPADLPTAESVSITVATGHDSATATAQAVADCTSVDGQRVCDVNGDGDYRDVNGDGTVSHADVSFFQERQHRPAWKRPELFDLNDNGVVGHGDVVTLFEYVASGSL